VLLVDDEPAIREVVERCLRALGYEILVRADGEAALATLRDRATRVDLLLSDIVMPGIGGAELVRAARELRPGLRCLLMSGYAESAEAHAHLAAGMAEFLPKPFSLRQLGDAVREAALPSARSA
jgi:two-component system cell cycle sensor histidine kinase/response regulator CckA